MNLIRAISNVIHVIYFTAFKCLGPCGSILEGVYSKKVFKNCFQFIINTAFFF
jgi:hypothetical protein